VADVKSSLLLRDLIRLMDRLKEMQGELADRMRSKLDAIRKADTDAIHAITAHEMKLVEQIREREGLRRQIMRQLAVHLGLTDVKGDAMTASELARHISEPQRSRLLTTVAGLRERLNEVEQLRVTSALISQEMLKHMDVVMNVMRSGGATSELYSRTGSTQRASGSSVFEAVG
jgi:hypothetical protein